MKKFKNRTEKLNSFSKQEMQVLAETHESLASIALTEFKSRSMTHAIYCRMLELGVDTNIIERSSKAKMRRVLDAALVERKKKWVERFEECILPVLFIKDSPLTGKRARGYISQWNPLYNWLEYKCQLCPNEGWHNGKPLKLQIDHINGDNFDHRLENLRYLCPNCHAQTETFTGGNIKKKTRE